MDDQTPKPQRRIRYKGTHPKSFTEKYKEQQPELYSTDISKVIAETILKNIARGNAIITTTQLQKIITEAMEQVS